MKLADAITLVKSWDMDLTWSDTENGKEYRVAFDPNSDEGGAYYTVSLTDAVCVARVLNAVHSYHEELS